MVIFQIFSDAVRELCACGIPAIELPGYGLRIDPWRATCLRFQFETSSLGIDLICQSGISRSEEDLKSQIVTSRSWGGRRFPPYAFTEQGVAMLSSVLKSDRAVTVNIEIMRAFVRLREMIASNRDLAKRLDELEKKFDAQFKVVFDAIRQFMTPPEKEKRKIGFRRGEK